MKCVPNTSSSSLHSLTRQMDAVLKASRAVPLRLAELLFTTRWRKLSFLIKHSATHCRDLQGSGSSSVGVVFWPFQDPLRQLPLKCLQLLPQNLCHYPVLAAIEQYRHHTRFKNRSGGEGADVSLESTTTAIVEKTASSLLDVFVHRLCCKEISLPPVAQALPHITSWHHRPFDFAHWRDNIAILGDTGGGGHKVAELHPFLLLLDHRATKHPGFETPVAKADCASLSSTFTLKDGDGVPLKRAYWETVHSSSDSNRLFPTWSSLPLPSNLT